MNSIPLIYSIRYQILCNHLGLGENETAPTPPLSKPRNASEYEKQQAVQFSIQSGVGNPFLLENGIIANESQGKRKVLCCACILT